jgi:beta-N-acetylhexosaminidase
MSSELSRTIEDLIATGKPLALVALGNPYLLRAYPKATAYLATFSTVAPSEIAAVRALWGEMAIRGHLPVTIPGEARYGEGIPLPATHAATNSVNQK